MDWSLVLRDPLGDTREQAPASNRALEEFLRGHECKALRIAELSLRGRDEALDCVQEAMLRLARHYGHKPEAQWRPLFYRILHNQIKDALRRASVRGRRLVEIDAMPGEVLASGPASDPHAVVEGEQTREVLQTALRALPLRQQQAFVLRAWEGLATRETAFAMGCSEGSVKTHYHRALGALRAALAAGTER